MSGSVTVNDLTEEDRHNEAGPSAPGRLALPYRIPRMVENPLALLGLAIH